MLITRVYAKEGAKVGSKTNLRKRLFLFIKITCHYRRSEEQKQIQVAIPDIFILARDNKTPS